MSTIDLNPRIRELVAQHRRSVHRRMDRAFAGLMGFQFLAGIACAIAISPVVWRDAPHPPSGHVATAIVVGGMLAFAPIGLVLLRPGTVLTRHAIAIGQMLFSLLLVHLTAGRAETYFHAFGSLAVLALYREWPLLVSAMLVVAGDHAARAWMWPETTLGLATLAPLQAFERLAWLGFEAALLGYGCIVAAKEAERGAAREAELESVNTTFERRAVEQTRVALDQTQELTSEVVARVQAEQAAEEALGQLRARDRAIDAALIMVATDLQGKTTSVNDNFLRLTGYSRADVIGRRLVGSEERPWTPEQRTALERGEPWRGDVCERTSGGQPYWVSTTMIPITDEGGHPQSYLSISVDITEQKRLQSQLVQAQKLESIGQLAAGIAHEINTPAQYVSDNTRFLRDQFAGMMKVLDSYARELDPQEAPKSWAQRRAEIRATLDAVDYDFLRREIPEAIAQSLEGIERITQIVTAMKDFSHPGSEHKEAANLNKAIESTVTVCRNRWKYAADLHLELDPQLPPVPCLLAEFNQVILNLVVNAADAIEAHLRGQNQKGEIRVSTRRDGDWVEVRVQDNGPGIPEANRARIFEPFFTTKEVGKGTGQGLAISRNVVVNKHGGSLGFESRVGEGTCFIVRLPLVAAEPQRRAA